MSENLSLPPENAAILPRSAWNSQLTYLKLKMKAKQALDKAEQELSRVRQSSKIDADRKNPQF